jgi:aspartate 1-decarboxylase
MLKSKIHRATVTQADLEYEGSLTIDRTLMEAADILEGEEVHVWNVTRGTRLTTYAIEGEPDSGVMCVNGAAAHLAQAGDLVIVASFISVPENTAHQFRPKVVMVDGKNEIKSVDLPEIPGPARREAVM